MTSKDRRKQGKSYKGKIPLVVLVVISLALSVFFSFRSLTGYVISEDIDVVGNSLAFLFFLIGISGSYFLLWKR